MNFLNPDRKSYARGLRDIKERASRPVQARSFAWRGGVIVYFILSIHLSEDSS